MGILPLLVLNTAPIFITLFIGWLVKEIKLIDENGLTAIKKIVTNITLPFVIFQAFFTATYNTNSIIILIIIFGVNLLTFGLGHILKRFLPNASSLLPFKLSGFEMGMLGFPLFALLVDAHNSSILAIVDLGHELFVFTIYIYFLRNKSQKKLSAKESIIDIIRNPVLISLIIGLILGATDIASFLLDSIVGDIVLEIATFISAPTAFLILITIGYDFVFQKKLSKRLFATLFFRLFQMAILGAATIFIIFNFIPYDDMLLLALIMMFILPAPFTIPVYTTNKEDSEFVSAFLSLNTLVTIILFAGLIVYANYIL